MSPAVVQKSSGSFSISPKVYVGIEFGALQHQLSTGLSTISDLSQPSTRRLSTLLEMTSGKSGKSRRRPPRKSTSSLPTYWYNEGSSTGRNLMSFLTTVDPRGQLPHPEASVCMMARNLCGADSEVRDDGLCGSYRKSRLPASRLVRVAACDVHGGQVLFLCLRQLQPTL